MDEALVIDREDRTQHARREALGADADQIGDRLQCRTARNRFQNLVLEALQQFGGQHGHLGFAGRISAGAAPIHRRGPDLAIRNAAPGRRAGDRYVRETSGHHSHCRRAWNIDAKKEIFAIDDRGNSSAKRPSRLCSLSLLSANALIAASVRQCGTTISRLRIGRLLRVADLIHRTAHQPGSDRAVRYRDLPADKRDLGALALLRFEQLAEMEQYVL